MDKFVLMFLSNIFGRMFLHVPGLQRHPMSPQLAPEVEDNKQLIHKEIV